MKLNARGLIGRLGTGGFDSVSEAVAGPQDGGGPWALGA